MAELALKSGHVVLLDDDDLPTVLAAGSWWLKRDGRTLYAKRTVIVPGPRRRDREIMLHSFLTNWPLVDHINGNGLDNRRVNLRRATRQQNSANRHAVLSASGFKGVTFHRETKRWQAAICQAGKSYHLGLHDTAEQAARAYDAAAIKLFGEFARPNFPVLREDGES